jgi:hypothetical protein
VDLLYWQHEGTVKRFLPETGTIKPFSAAPQFLPTRESISSTRVWDIPNADKYSTTVFHVNTVGPEDLVYDVPKAGTSDKLHKVINNLQP